MAAKKEKKPLPGSPILDSFGQAVSWHPWTMEDLNPKALVSFVPQPLPGVTVDDYGTGQKKILIDVNDLKCWLTVGEVNTVNQFFWNPYNDILQMHIAGEEFKRKGPDYPWWTDLSGKSTWHYEAQALTFGIDLNGRYVNMYSQPIPGPSFAEKVVYYFTKYVRIPYRIEARRYQKGLAWQFFKIRKKVFTERDRIRMELEIRAEEARDRYQRSKRKANGKKRK